MHLNFSYSCVQIFYTIFQTKWKKSNYEAVKNNSGMSFNATWLPHDPSPVTAAGETKKKNRKTCTTWNQSVSASSRNRIGQHTHQSQQQEAVMLHSGDVGTNLSIALRPRPHMDVNMFFSPSFTLFLQLMLCLLALHHLNAAQVRETWKSKQRLHFKLKSVVVTQWRWPAAPNIRGQN